MNDEGLLKMLNLLARVDQGVTEELALKVLYSRNRARAAEVMLICSSETEKSVTVNISSFFNVLAVQKHKLKKETIRAAFKNRPRSLCPRDRKSEAEEGVLWE
ncbi:unnamed protein product [Clonostachys byssicola]|uniref:Uncharacterized protein n=1 Tax=Clonostachys byssicola TaxID=160290 RepID=A0A9N9Y3C7_9HYPO|nr:unnamed protein product [Clonostachys byssicola]